MKLLHFTSIISLFLLLVISSPLFFTSCEGVPIDYDGNSHSVDNTDSSVDYSEGVSSNPECGDAGGTITNGVVTATIFGNPCLAPSVSEYSADSTLILNCTERIATKSTVDYAKIECGTDGATIRFYCNDSNLLTCHGDCVSDTSNDLLYETTIIGCSSDNQTVLVDNFTDSLEYLEKDFD